jgi:tetratricopeptide (TPR) repeat protein
MNACFAALILTLVTLPGAFAQAPSAAAAAVPHIGTAVRLMQERRYSEAAVEFEQALAADPNNDTLRIQYATCLFAEERNDDARREFEMLQKRLGDREGLEYYLGLLDVRADRFDSAIRRLKPLQLNPAFPKASFYLGLAYLGSGETGPALDSLERAAKSNPGDPDVHYRLGRVYSMKERTGDAEREYALYRSARENQRIVEQEAPACMDALRSQPIAKAREVCQRIGAPGDSRRLILLGQLYAEAGAFADAVEPLRQAAKLDAKSFEAWHYLGLSFYGLKRYPEALAPLRKASELNPQFFDTLNLLAKTLYVLGDYAAALPVLERAHSLNPSDGQLAAVLDRLRANAGRSGENRAK